MAQDGVTGGLLAGECGGSRSGHINAVSGCELFPAKSQPISGRPVSDPGRQHQRLAVHVLQPVPQHRAVHFVQQGAVDPHLVVGGDAHQIAVVSGVVDLAQRHPICHYGKPSDVRIFNDVGRVEEFCMLELAHRARAGVGVHDSCPERGLVQALEHGSFGVATLVPAAMHEADQLPGLRAGTGLTVVSWLLRVGFLLSPPIVGFIADASGLRFGLIIVPVVGVIVVLFSGVLSTRLRLTDNRA